MKPICEKHHRLTPECYRGFVRVVFTACISKRKYILSDTSVATAFQEILIREATKSHCDVMVYLFMPDHCHIILEGKTESADTLLAMGRFKQHSGYWLYRNLRGVQWQKDFYDHIIRTDDATRKHVEYVLQNPVRKGLVTNWKEYPYKGSTVFNFDEW